MLSYFQIFSALLCNASKVIMITQNEVFCQRTLREKCPYSEFFWSVISRIWTEYGEMLCISPYSRNVGKCGPEKLRIRTLFTQWNSSTNVNKCF